MSKTQEIDIKIKGKIDPSFNTSVNGAGKKLNGFGKSGSEAYKGINKASQALSNLDNMMMSVGIAKGIKAISSAMYDCVKAADEYETAVAKIETIADTSVTSVSEISKSLKELSNKTGQDVSELAESTYQAISASVDTANSVQFVEQANELAVGGFTNTTSAVNVLTTALNAYGLGAEKAQSISDMLIQTQNKGKTTVDELASSLGTVIPTAAAYNTNMANISTSYAQLTKNGIATANAGTYIRAMLNELAKSGSTVSDILKEQTGKSFAELMAEGKSLGDVLEILGGTVYGNTTAFAGLWSNARAAQGALAIFNAGGDAFNETLQQMENSTGLTSQAYNVMASTAEYSEKRMSNAFNNLKISIGEALSPSIASAENGIAKMLMKLDEFVQENPKVVQAISAGVLGLSIFIGTITAAKLSVIAFNAVLNTNPIFFAVSAVVALTASITALAIANTKETVTSETLTEAAKKQSTEMEKLNKKHDQAVKKYGENSYEAKKLEKQISELNTEIAGTSQTYGELFQANEKLNKAYAEIDNDDKIVQLNNEADSSINLIDRLYKLGKQSKLTASEQAEMGAIVDHLNEMFPELGLKVEDVGKKTATTKKALKEMLNQEYNQQKLTEANEGYFVTLDQIDENEALLKELNSQKDSIDKIYEEEKKAANKYKGVKKKGTLINEVSDKGTSMLLDAENKHTQSLKKEITFEIDGEEKTMSLAAALKETRNRIKELKKDNQSFLDTSAKLQGITDENTKSQNTWKQAATTALRDVKEDVEKLTESYSEEYSSAYKAISGTVGLFGDLSNESDKTVSQIRESLQNEYEWVSNYSANIQKAQSYGISKGLITSLSDGSEKSGQYINEIITQLDNLDQASANELVKSLNSDFKKVKDSEKNFADTVAKYKTDYEKSIEKIEKSAKKAYKNILNSSDISKESYQNGIKAMESYLQGMNYVKGNAKSILSNQEKSLLKNYNISLFDASNIEKNASGTKHSASMFLAGEKGTELVLNAGGSQVFTADETKRILSGVNNDGTSYSIDLPELFKQQVGGLSLKSLSDQLDNYVINSDNSTSTITFAPVITFPEGSNVSKSDVKKVVSMSMTEFSKLMDRYNKEKSRKEFKK